MTTAQVTLRSVRAQEEGRFLELADRYFHELSASFSPTPQWQERFLTAALDDELTRVDWIIHDRREVGFTIYGWEPHRYLDRSIGKVHEFFIVPEQRDQGVGGAAARAVLAALRRREPLRIELEIASGNHAGLQFWDALGFRVVATRLALANEAAGEAGGRKR